MLIQLDDPTLNTPEFTQHTRALWFARHLNTTLSTVTNPHFFPMWRVDDEGNITLRIISHYKKAGSIKYYRHSTTAARLGIPEYFDWKMIVFTFEPAFNDACPCVYVEAYTDTSTEYVSIYRAPEPDRSFGSLHSQPKFYIPLIDATDQRQFLRNFSVTGQQHSKPEQQD